MATTTSRSWRSNEQRELHACRWTKEKERASSECQFPTCLQRHLASVSTGGIEGTMQREANHFVPPLSSLGKQHGSGLSARPARMTAPPREAFRPQRTMHRACHTSYPRAQPAMTNLLRFPSLAGRTGLLRWERRQAIWERARSLEVESIAASSAGRVSNSSSNCWGRFTGASLGRFLSIGVVASQLGKKPSGAPGWGLLGHAAL